MTAVADFIESHIDFVVEHLLPIVFLAFLIEGAGIPFPSRILLLVAAAMTAEPRGLLSLGAVCVGGALIGDHVPYLAGMLSGPRMLAFYCRITLGSAQCVEKTVRFFTRFGPAAILLSRFSTTVRVFAAALSGCGHIPYPRFLALDIAGTVVYATLLVTVGYLIGDAATEFLQRPGRLRLLLLAGPLALTSLLAFRLYRRSRYGPAKSDSVRGGAACLAGEAEPRRPR